MGAITGAFATGAVQVAGTWGTAVEAGAGDRFAGEISISPSVDLITARSVGSGLYMATAATRGNVQYSASVTADLGFRNGCDTILAVFFGTSGAPTEVTTGEGDYLHTITVNATPTKYLTLAYESTGSTAHELPTCVVTSWGISSTSIRGYVDFTAELLANDLALSTSVNDNTALDATTYTETSPELVISKQTDSYWANTWNGDTLDSGDLLAITGFDFSMERPYELIPEIKGAAGFSAPVASGLITGTLSLELKQLDDHSQYTIWTAETSQKARLIITGSTIAGGTSKTFDLRIPKMTMVDAPNFSLTSEGRNPLSLSYTMVNSVSNPNGMGFPYPHILLTNTLSTTLLP